MCAANSQQHPSYNTPRKFTVPTSGSPTSVSQDHTTAKMKPSSHSTGNKKPYTKSTSGNSAQKPNGSSRNEKRARWAKRSKPVAKPIVRRGPEKEYISACCSVPARKPRAGTKETMKDPGSGKMKDMAKGLGHWRCGQCGKDTKVTPRKPAPKETPKVEVSNVVA